MAKIAPSILAADFARLGEDVKDICNRGADYLHIDVMDGIFVPNISFGADVMKSLDHIAGAPYDVHMMIIEPDRYLERFKDIKTIAIAFDCQKSEEILPVAEVDIRPQFIITESGTV